MQYTAFDLQSAYEEMTGRKLQVRKMSRGTCEWLMGLYEKPDIKNPVGTSGKFKLATTISAGVAAVTSGGIVAASMMDHEPIVKYLMVSSLAVTHAASWVNMYTARRQEFG